MEKQTLTERFKELRDGLYTREGSTIRESWFKFNTFIDFNETPLHPSQFIAWDMEQNCPMEKPEDYEQYLKTGTFGLVNGVGLKCINYQQALDRVLFEGFEYCKETRADMDFILNTVDDIIFWVDELKDKTIADLKGVELNKNGIKLAGYDTRRKDTREDNQTP